MASEYCAIISNSRPSCYRVPFAFVILPHLSDIFLEPFPLLLLTVHTAEVEV